MFQWMLNKLGKDKMQEGGNAMKKLLVVLLALTLLASCAPAPTPTPTPKPTVPAAPTAVPATATPALTPSPEVDEEHTLIVAIGSDYGSLDWCVGGFHPLQNEARKHIFAYLNDYGVKELPDGTLVGDIWSTEPVLAESIEVSEDGLVHTIRIPAGLKHYPSGNEVTSDDWIYYASRWAGTGRQLPETIAGGYATKEDPTRGYRVVDKYTVQFAADHWTPLLKPLLVYNILPDSAEYKKHATKEDPWGTEWAHTNMVGCGPYYIADRVAGEYSIWLANPYYPPVNRRGKDLGFEVFFKKIEFRVVPSEADRFMMLKTGDIDIAWEISPKLINELKEAEGVRVITTPRGDMVGLMMHNQLKPFDDARVRRAVSYMMPYKDIIEKVYYGLATAVKGPVPGMAAGSDPSFWPYDVSEEEAINKAKALLAEAGYPDGVEFPLVFEAGGVAFETVATLIQGQMAKAGIKVKIEPMPRAAMVEAFAKGQLVASLQATFPYVPDAGYYLNWLFACNAPMAQRIGYCNSKVDELVNQAMVERDEAKRNKLYSEAQRLVIEDAPWAFICARNGNRAMRSDIQGFIEYPDNRYRYQQLWRGK